MIIVSSDVKPPPHPFYGDSYERGVDPFHPDAFSGLGLSDSIIKKLAVVWPGPRRNGWFILDMYGQEVGFIPDGTKYVDYWG